MRSHVALLRGINVGGNCVIKMADLRQLFADVGLGDAQTLLQSGNVAFQSEGRTQDELESLLEEEVLERLGVRTTFFVRTAKEWDGMIAENPFAEEAKNDPGHLLAVLLKTAPDPKAIEAVQAAINGPERIRAVGDNLYVVYPEGIGPSKVSRTPGWNKLIGVGTGRNWNTVLKLSALTGATGT